MNKSQIRPRTGLWAIMAYGGAVLITILVASSLQPNLLGAAKILVTLAALVTPFWIVNTNWSLEIQSNGDTLAVRRLPRRIEINVDLAERAGYSPFTATFIVLPRRRRIDISLVGMPKADKLQIKELVGRIENRIN